MGHYSLSPVSFDGYILAGLDEVREKLRERERKRKGMSVREEKVHVFQQLVLVENEGVDHPQCPLHCQ